MTIQVPDDHEFIVMSAGVFNMLLGLVALVVFALVIDAGYFAIRGRGRRA